MRSLLRGRLLSAFALLSLSLAGAANAQRFTALIDLDMNAATGCSVATPSGTVSGFEWRVTATVAGDNPPTVTAVERAPCSGAAFGAPIAQAAGYAVGLNNGTGGADVVESSVVLANIAPFGTTARVVALAETATASDLTGAAQVSGFGGGVGTGEPVLIPSLHWFGISLLIFGLLLMARRSRALRGTAALLLLMGAGLVYAANFAADGAVGDWIGETTDVTDAAGDTSTPDPRIDLRAFFAAAENGALFFRFDVAELQNLPDAPNAVNDAFTVAEDATLNGNVLDGSGSGGTADSDPDNDPLTTSVSVQPASGTLVLNANGSFTYTPNANFNGADSFSYTLSDGTGTDTAQVAITVSAVNDAPVANADAHNVGEDTPLTVAAPGLLGNDTDVDGDPLTAAVAVGPTNGNLVLNADGGFTYTPNANYTGADSFTYRANDGTADSAPATVTLTVGGNNDLPVAVDDNYSVAEDGSLTQPAPGVLSNDTDGDGDTLAATLSANVANGTLALNPDGSFTYTPNANFNGTDTFSYTVADGNGGQDAGTVTLTVTPVNDAPAAVADSFSTTEDTALTNIDPTANDTIGDAPFTVTAFQNPSAQGGTVTLNGDNTFNYTPAANFTGTDTFTYTVTDNDGETSTATVTITVAVQTDPPVATADAHTVAEGGTLNIAAPGVLGNDSDPDGDTLTAVLVSGPANASSFTLNADGSFNYTHDGGETAADSFSYRANDGGNDSNIVTVSISVTPVNDLPQAQADSFAVTEDTPLNVAAPGVLVNDSDAEGGVTAVLVADVANGTLVLNADGSFTYTPDLDYTGPDSFTYTARDGASADSAVTTVSLTVSAFNDVPVAVADSYSTNEDSPLTDGAPGVLGNDTDAEGTTLTAALVTGPANAASFTLNPDGSFTYQPAANFNGSDGFTYSASDGAGSSNATVTITVAAVDDTPTANPDVFATNEDQPFTTTALTANDALGDTPTAITAIDATGTGGGSLAAAGGDTYTYTPVADFDGADVFNYTITDNDGQTSSSTVTFNVGSVNDLPVAGDDSASVAEGGTVNVAAPGVLGNDSDTETPQASLTAAVVAGPSNASSFTLNADGSYTYVHDGSETTSDSFTYQANDGAANSNTATVVITVTPVNDVPATVADAYTVAEGGTLNVAAATGLLANDTDAENNPMTTALVSGPANASSFTLNADGSFAYVHDGSETLTDSFTYRANDGIGDSTPTLVTITVTAVNDPPSANDDAYSLNEGGTLNVVAPGVLANDVDAEGALTAAVVTGPANASSFTLNADGSFSYVHDGSETTSDSFTYSANDGSTTVNATVTLTIGAQNDAPAAANDGFTVAEGGTLAPAAPGVLGNDTDAENDTLTATLVAGPSNASSFTLNGDGSFNYVHDGGPSTSDTFSYRAVDPALSNVATVSITITPVNDAPVAVADADTVAEGGTLNGASVLGNDTDEENDPLTAVLVAGPANATSFTLAPDGTYSYVHNGGETTSDSFTYRANDGSLDSNIVTVALTITPVDDPADANDDAATVAEDAAATTVTVFANDTDVDGPAFTIAAATDPANGTLTLAGPVGAHTGVQYAPDLNYCNTNTGTPDTFSYTLVNGDSATVSMTVTCINDPPVADDETFDTLGNTELRIDIGAAATPHVAEATVSGTGVRDGDADPVESHPISVTSIVGCADVSAPYDCTLPSGSLVSMTADGDFTFRPSPTLATGAHTPDTFQYVITDQPLAGDGAPATDTGQVTIRVFDKIWYVQRGASGNGRSDSPLGTFAPIHSVGGGGDGDVAGDVIYVHSDATPLDSFIELEANQVLLGGGAALTTIRSLNGDPPPVLIAAGTDTPVRSTAGDTIRIGNAIPAEIRGLALGSGAAGSNAIDLTTTGATTGLGTLTIADNTFTGATAEGIDVNANSATRLTLAITNNDWSLAGTHADSPIDINNANAGADTLRLNLSGNTNLQTSGADAALQVNGGAVARTLVTGFADNSVHGNSNAAGVAISNVTFDANPVTAGQQQVDGNVLPIGTSGNPVGGAGFAATGSQGSLSFDDLDVFAAAGTGLQLGGTGAGLSFAVVPAAPDGSGSSSIDADNGPALDVSSTAIDLRLSSLQSNTATSGLAFNTVTGQFRAATGSQITKASGAGTAFAISGSNVVSDYAGSLSVTSGAGVSLTTNAGSTMTFRGGMTLSTGANAAFGATGGGTVHVCDENACNGDVTGGLVNTLTTTTGIALNVDNTTIGASDLEFRSISAGTAASGPSSGIILNNTGNSGGLWVKGSGTAGSGGTIQRTASGILMTSTRDVSIDRMQLNDHTDFAIRGTSVVNFAMANTVINGVNGNDAGADEGSVRFNELTGTASVTASAISGSVEHNMQVINTSGLLDRITVSSTTFGPMNAVTGSDGLLIETLNSAVINATVQNNVFTHAVGDHFQFAGNGSSANDVVFNGNTVSNAATAVSGGGGLRVVGGSNTGPINFGVTFDMMSNTVRDSRGTALAANKLGGNAAFSGVIENNVIGVAGVANSGSQEGSNIFFLHDNAGSHTVAVRNNQTRQYSNYGIYAQTGGSGTVGSGTLNATVTGNTASNPGTLVFAKNGAHLNGGTTPGDTYSMCFDLGGAGALGNTLAGSGTDGGTDFRVRHRQNTTVRLPSYAGAIYDTAAVQLFLEGRNTGAESGSAASSSAGGGFVGGAACPQP